MAVKNYSILHGHVFVMSTVDGLFQVQGVPPSCKATFMQKSTSLYHPQTVFVGGYTVFTLSDRPNERPSDRTCVRNVLFP